MGNTAQKEAGASGLEVMLQDVENAGQVDDGSELTYTQSLQADLQAGLGTSEALKARALRAKIREIDADISELNAELVRRSLLRGPSELKAVCDENCIIGGCGGEFSVSSGISCTGCNTFVCYGCFGRLVITNECQVGGRYDAMVPGQDHADSLPGSLPCPLFPQNCAVGHISLVETQRALLDPKNRGADGEQEDLNSSGHSPHKIYLLGRRRQAEAQLADPGSPGARDEGTPSLVSASGLLRTISEVRVETHDAV
eukprot:SAG22_NODE_4617_length_1214_cov_1.327354_1_plen_255_part_01